MFPIVTHGLADSGLTLASGIYDILAFAVGIALDFPDARSDAYNTAKEYVSLARSIPLDDAEVLLGGINDAASKIKKDHPDFKGDLGVRVYKETESHFPQWQAQAFKTDEDLKQAMLDYGKAPITGSVFDRATEVLLKLGYPLTTEVVEKDGYMLAQNEVALVLDSKFAVKNLQKVIETAPKTIIVLEKLFKKDEEKINFALRCKEAGLIFQTV